MAKRKKITYTNAFKLKVLTWFNDNGRCYSSTADEFGIDRRTIKSWENTTLYTEAVANDLKITQYVGRTELNLERSVPAEIQEVAKILVQDMAALNMKVLFSLNYQVQKYVDKTNEKKDLTPQEVEQLIKINRVLSPYTTNQNISGIKTESVFEAIQQKLSGTIYKKQK